MILAGESFLKFLRWWRPDEEDEDDEEDYEEDDEEDDGVKEDNENGDGNRNDVKKLSQKKDSPSRVTSYASSYIFFLVSILLFKFSRFLVQV